MSNFSLYHVCLSAHMEQFVSHWTDFHEILYLSVFRKRVEDIQVSLKSDKNNGYFTRRSTDIFDHISLISSQNEKCFRQKLQTKSKHILCSVNFFLRKWCIFCKIVQKTVVERGRPLMTIWHMCISCWIPQATNTPSLYVILNAFPLQQWLNEGASCTYIACLFQC